jgi:hypothetical protein
MGPIPATEGGAPRSSSGETIRCSVAALDQWASAEIQTARLGSSGRALPAVFYAWTAARRLTVQGVLDVGASVAKARVLRDHFLSDEGWATTPAGRVEVGLVEVIR